MLLNTNGFKASCLLEILKTVIIYRKINKLDEDFYDTPNDAIKVKVGVWLS